MSHSREPMPDYYSILGVLRDAKPEEITAAYYLLARKFHPDVTTEGSSAQRQFKAINEAYQILSDPSRRRQYDRVQRRRSRRHGPGHRRPSRRPHPVAWWTGPRPPSSPPSPSRGARSADIHVQLPITPEEARHGGICPFTLHWSDPCDRCSATGTVADAVCPDCGGAKSRRRRESLRIRLPAGLQTGTTVRLAGKGHRAVGTDRRGDLYLQIVVRPCW